VCRPRHLAIAVRAQNGSSIWHLRGLNLPAFDGPLRFDQKSDCAQLLYAPLTSSLPDSIHPGICQPWPAQHCAAVVVPVPSASATDKPGLVRKCRQSTRTFNYRYGRLRIDHSAERAADKASIAMAETVAWRDQGRRWKPGFANEDGEVYRFIWIGGTERLSRLLTFFLEQGLEYLPSERVAGIADYVAIIGPHA
jgi:hypothetical protein